MTVSSARGGTMDSEKPFKTIEVIDSRTSQLCKVACMSCIRGHRTTSCGIPVCRTKIFWTVKRPGRPSNSCTCRYGATGGCKCVVARTACPHKSRKGEKRSGECRCDEQGRFCCILEQEHWSALIALRKPIVDFFSSRDALEARQSIVNTPRGPRTPSIPMETPHLSHGQVNGAVVYQRGYRPVVPPLSTSYGLYHPSQTTLTPRFGFLGIGGPQGLPENSTPDILTWQGEAPQAPHEWHPAQAPPYTPPEQGSCCQGSSSGIHSNALTLPNAFDLSTTSPYTPSTDAFADSTPLASDQILKGPTSSFERFQMDYITRQQQANAICQSCGLGGCNCRNCPPVFQNPNDTSWGQGCGRKHARETPTRHVSEPTNKVARLRPDHVAATGNSNGPYMPPLSNAHRSYVNGRQNMPLKHPQTMNILPPPTEKYTGLGEGMLPDLGLFGFEGSLHMPGDQEALDISQYLISDLDRSDRQRERGESNSGCCCGGS